MMTVICHHKIMKSNYGKVIYMLLKYNILQIDTAISLHNHLLAITGQLNLMGGVHDSVKYGVRHSGVADCVIPA